jgi:ABC-2 type transport system permease protein
MNKTLIILKNELFTTLRRKGFIIATLAIPILGLLGILTYQLVTNVVQPSSTDEIKRIGYVDQTGIFKDYTKQGKIELVAYATEEQAKADLVKEDIKEYFVIPADYVSSGLITRYTLKTDLEPPSDVINAGQSFLVDNLVKDKVSPEIVERVKYPAALASVVLDKQGNVAEGQGGLGAWLISYLFGILLMISIFTASGYLLQGLSEEKENRIMEILLSSVSTRQLITGKVLGLGISGLIQMAIWLFSAWGLLNLASGSIGGMFSSIQFPASVVGLGLLYYILGYFLFSILMAGAGAIAPTVRDAQQMTIVFSLLAAIPYFLMGFIIENGDHIVNKVLTLFPFTAPLTVMMRLNAGIPLWEIAVSATLLVLAIIGFLLLVSKIFRIYLLMYGKAPGWREVMKSLRQS